jgi:cell division protein FtsZ
MENLMPFDLPIEKGSIIKVVGVGGGGSNAVSHMFKQGITDVDFIICNTDQQALVNSPVPIKIHLGQTLTEGLGAGNKPERGKEAAIENLDDVVKVLSNNTKMVFITAGMGGGTGTGAAPVIAKAARDLGILTVGIVTIPFRFEGKRRIDQAINGVKEINKHVDSLLVINNERLREIYGNLGISDAFSKADDVLTVAAKGIAEIITKKGHVNVDFADVKTVMNNSGVAIMGSGIAEGEGRALKAIEEALNSPLLNNNDITGAKNILLNISFGEVDLKTDELVEITQFAQEAAGHTADIIWGYNQDPSLDKKINVTIIATGFETDVIPELYVQKPINKKVVEIEHNKGFIPRDIQSESNLYLDDIEFEVTHTKEEMNIVPPTSTYKKEIVPEIVQETFISTTIEKTKQEGIKRENTIDEEERVRKALERMKLMENMKMQQKNAYRNKKLEQSAQSIDELENEPAYKRRNTELSQEQSYKGKEISRYTLSDEDDDLDLSENSFLHDNVD